MSRGDERSYHGAQSATMIATAARASASTSSWLYPALFRPGPGLGGTAGGLGLGDGLEATQIFIAEPGLIAATTPQPDAGSDPGIGGYLQFSTILPSMATMAGGLLGLS